MNTLTLLHQSFNFVNFDEILEQIKKGGAGNGNFCHIISINTENFVTILHQEKFREVVVKAQFHIPDGVGITWAAQFLHKAPISRLSGVDVMKKVLEQSSRYSLRVLLIGGKANLADYISKCYVRAYPELKIVGIQGILDISNPQKTEESAIFHIVATTRPHIVFVSFGSPAQELWIERHRSEWGDAVVMGVGGAFDLIAGTLPRAPQFIQSIGLEWLFRLIQQPWRIFRQVKLIEFVIIIMKAKIQKWFSR